MKKEFISSAGKISSFFFFFIFFYLFWISLVRQTEINGLTSSARTSTSLFSSQPTTTFPFWIQVTWYHAGTTHSILTKKIKERDKRKGKHLKSATQREKEREDKAKKSFLFPSEDKRNGRERETQISHHPFPLKLHYPTSFEQVVSHNTHFLHLKTQYPKKPQKFTRPNEY